MRTTAGAAEPHTPGSAAGGRPPLRARARTTAGATFAALQYRNYRLFFVGQAVSVSGTWMQQVAQALLVLDLTGSGTALGLVTAARFVPVLVGGPWGGVLADRLDKRRLLVLTQAAAGVLAFVLGLVVVTGVVQLWMVFVLAALLGCVNAVDNPTRQTFVSEMVRPEHLTNAVTLNSVVMNGARIVGPSIAGVTIYLFGVGPCFLLNGVSYAGVIAALSMMRPEDLLREAARPRTSRDLRAGFRYVREHRELRTTLLVVALVGTLTYEFNVSLPLLAEFTFDAGSGGLATMLSAMGAGAVVGGLAGAARGTPSPRRLAGTSLVFGAALAALAASPTLPIALAVLPFVGACSINFIAMANSMLQLRADPHMRGRVMALYGVAFMGSTPVGGPIVGWVGEHHGARTAILLGAAAAVVASAAMWTLLDRDGANRAAPG